ncbi:MAG: TonB family protein [Prevotellaceae bacterium]|jgi:TonB family protein|nr:TonB family protein [Prevotellaceae bacterium]
MALAKIDVEKREEEYFSQRRWKSLICVILFHCVTFFALSKFGFDRTYPPPPMQGIEIAIELERPRVQGVPRRNPQQRPVPNPSIVNAPGKAAPETAKVSTRNESTKPAPQPETKPSELSDEGDVPVEAPKPKIDNKALFQSTSQGEEEANNPNPIDENSLYPGVGAENEATRTADTPIGPDHRQPVTHNLSGRSVVGGFPLPQYNSQNRGTVVVEVTVNQEGKVVTARAVGTGSTTQDAVLWKAAEEAALKTRFNVKKDAPISQIGKITYVFSLK